jgi:hypothetical protein
MPSELFTKHYGKVVIEQSWQDGIFHVGKLHGVQGYVHMTGLPVSSENELREAICPGPDLDLALAWFAKKDDVEEHVKREIKIVNGEFMFTDGSQLESVADLVNNLPAGPILDAAYEWFKRKQKEDKSPAAKAALTAAEKKPTKEK